MELIGLTEGVTDERKAEEILKGDRILKRFVACPYCGNKCFGKVKRNSNNTDTKRKWEIRNYSHTI